MAEKRVIEIQVKTNASQASTEISGVAASSTAAAAGVTTLGNASNVTLSSLVFTAEGYLDVDIPINVARVITLTLDTDYLNGNTDTNYIIIDQV